MTHAFALVRCCRIFNYIRPPAQEYIPFFRKCHNKLLYNEELRILFSAYSCRRGPDYPQAHLWLDCLLTGLAESCWVSEQLLKLRNSAKMSNLHFGNSATLASFWPWNSDRNKCCRITYGHTGAVHLHYPKQTFWVCQHSKSLLPFCCLSKQTFWCLCGCASEQTNIAHTRTHKYLRDNTHSQHCQL